MRKFDIELAVGLFMIAGIICLGYLSIKLGKMEILGSKETLVNWISKLGNGA